MTPVSAGRKAGSACDLDVVVFDLGGVVPQWQPELAYARVLPPDQVAPFMTKIDFRSWNRSHDAGQSFEEGEAAGLSRFPGDEAAIRAYRTHFAHTLTGMVAPRRSWPSCARSRIPTSSLSRAPGTGSTQPVRSSSTTPRPMSPPRELWAWSVWTSPMRAQVALVRRAHYAELDDAELVVLRLRAEATPIVVEDLGTRQPCPHLYAPLCPPLVADVTPYRADGGWVSP